MSTPLESTTVIGLHAFTRSPARLTALHSACTSRGWGWIAPSLAPSWLPVLMHSRRHLRRIADRLAMTVGGGGSVVLVGHSAGAAAACQLALFLRTLRITVLGIVLVDGTDSPNKLIETNLPALRSVPIWGVLAPPNPCNRQGALEILLAQGRPGDYEVIAGSGHGDIEMEDSRIYRRACRDASTPLIRQQVLEHTVTAISLIVSGGRGSEEGSVSS
jgi:pimeloyl-ACP methyl ester carboxylesterase